MRIADTSGTKIQWESVASNETNTSYVVKNLKPNKQKIR